MQVVYEGPDDVLVVGTVELPRGVPVELPAAIAELASHFPTVRRIEPQRTSRSRAARTEAAEEE